MASSPSHNYVHHVFPSFHGEDVRKAFLSHILKELRRKGLDPFIDNDIERSKSIGPELKDAIRGSRIAIVLLSRNYASSTWCLNELVEIMKCRDELGQTVMTIFYEIDPSDVKKQTGEFGRIFEKTCVGKTNEDTMRWRQALAEVGQIAGEHSSNWCNEADMIEKIAIDVSNVLNNSTTSNYFDNLVGIGSHMEKMGSFLSLECDEVRMVGIWGPAGIGKTTIARALYEKLYSNFTHTAFMESIKGGHGTHYRENFAYMLHLQEQLLSETLNQKDLKIRHLGMAQERLKDKKVLVVLDDVDQLVQLKAMADQPQWFGHGSVIIITTQDLKLLKAHGIHHIYKVDFPPTDEALQIFCMYAFGQKSPHNGFEELSWKVIEIVGKLPLGLRVMGSYFRGMSKHEWKKELPRLRNNLDTEIESILKFSYEALGDEDKNLFLHIACFFNREWIGHLQDFLANFLYLRQGLRVLTEKSFISMHTGRIEMHNLLAQLGREIVRKQSIHDPGKRQFLVDAREICEVLTDSTGSRNVIGIDLNSSELTDELYMSERAFDGMCNLQFLRVYYGYGDHCRLYLPRDLNYLSRKLRVVHWRKFPMTCLPSKFFPGFLVKLDMRGSKLKKLWEGIQPLRNLKWMNLSASKNLKELPDLSTATNLQDLSLRDCSSLVELPSSIGNAINLEELDLTNCSSIVKLPFSIGNVTNLQKLYLSGCSSLVELPSSIENLTTLWKLDLKSCSSLVKLPSPIGNVINLKELYLSNCRSLVELPSSIGNATNLSQLELRRCSRLVELPSSIGNANNLKELDLSDCSSLVELPSSIGNAVNLWKVDLSKCSSLVKLPSSIGNIINLKKLNLSDCSSLVELPSSIGNATNIQNLKLFNCSSFMSLPSSIENLQVLSSLGLGGCSKLEALPTNINLKSLISLNLTDCSGLKSFPEISTDIKFLKLSGTVIEKVPASIRSWPRLYRLDMSYCKDLAEFPHVPHSITVLTLSFTGIQEVPSWVGKLSQLDRLVLNGCRKLVSLPQLPDSLSSLLALNCESLERLQCSFHNPKIRLNFANCFRLNQEARDIIIKTSTCRLVILPSVDVPAYFTFRATGGSMTIKLDERPLPSFSRFRACILLVKCEKDVGDGNKMHVTSHIMYKQNGRIVPYKSRDHFLRPPLTEHLYTFELEAEVNTSELIFEFRVHIDKWKILECGIRGIF